MSCGRDRSEAAAEIERYRQSIWQADPTEQYCTLGADWNQLTQRHLIDIYIQFLALCHHDEGTPAKLMKEAKHIVIGGHTRRGKHAHMCTCTLISTCRHAYTRIETGNCKDEGAITESGTS